MVYFCLQVSFNFVCEPFTKLSTLANSKNFENMFQNKGKEIPVVNLGVHRIDNDTDQNKTNFI